jgi:signal peptidase II
LNKKATIAVGIILLVLIIDQTVKIWIKTHFDIQESQPLIPGFLQLFFIENRGMAFGTTLGDSNWAKYALSIFRMLAILGIGYYILKLIKDAHTKTSYIIAIALIFAGAFGNLIDSMFYDLIFPMDPTIRTNHVLNEVGFPIHDNKGDILLREGGFMLGSVVDMFQFTPKWPEWMPFGIGGTDVFSAIWNIADASITLGVLLLLFRYRDLSAKHSETINTEEE